MSVLCPSCPVSVLLSGLTAYLSRYSTGTPQVILSPWWDCHDFANRVEWLGIGKWGNRNHAYAVISPSPDVLYADPSSADSPGHHESDLTPALLAVVGETPDAPEAVRTRARARELAEVAVGRRDAVYNKTTGRVEVAPRVVREAREGRDVAAAWIWNRVQELVAKKQ